MIGTTNYELTNKGIKTIAELEAAYYGGNSVTKADDPLLTSTTGVNNDIFGAEVWNQLNEKAKTWGILPKKPYTKAGFRVKTARGVTLGAGGVSENGTIPDTVKPTYVKLALTLKHVWHGYDGSTLKELRTPGNDDIGLDQVKLDIGEEHVRSINAMLLVETDTLAGDNFESIDRVCSNSAESAGLSAPSDNDIYGFDRSASTGLDAYVKDMASAAITKAEINLAIRTIEQNSGERPNVILTGYDTANDIEALFEAQGRMTYERVKTGVNGIETGAGNDVMLEVAMIKGIPMITDDAVHQDTKSRIYFLNTNYLWFEVARPTANFETTMDQMILLGRLGVEGGFMTAGELKCVRFSAQGKIKNII